MQKQYNKQTLHSNNLYQIFTYVKNYDIQNSSNVAGMLLYAKTNEEIKKKDVNDLNVKKINSSNSRLIYRFQKYCFPIR